MLVDIGGGTTDVIVFRSGSPWYSAVIPVGGNQLTRDLSVALRVPFHIAEELKTKWGHALPDAVASGEEVQIPSFDGQPRHTVSRSILCQPLHERLTETLKLILLKSREAGLRQLPPSGLVLTGGTAQIPGLKELVQKTINVPVRIAYPRGILGLPAELKKPAFSTSVGTLLWGIKHHGEKRPYRNGETTLRGHGSLLEHRRFLRPFGKKQEKTPA